MLTANPAIFQTWIWRRGRGVADLKSAMSSFLPASTSIPCLRGCIRWSLHPTLLLYSTVYFPPLTIFPVSKSSSCKTIQACLRRKPLLSPTPMCSPPKTYLSDTSLYSVSQEESQLSEEAGLSDQDIIAPEPAPIAARKPPKLGQSLQRRAASATANPNDTSATAQQMTAQQQAQQFQAPLPPEVQLAPRRGGRIVPVHQSRIQDRPPKVGEKDSSLKIKIELDLEVEVEIYARVKGDVMIGLM